MSERAPELPFSFDGAVLCIDHGLKFLGLAISHSGMLATPFMVIERQSKAEDFEKINRIICDEKIIAIVLGLPPIPPDFEGFSQADKVRNWATHLYATVPDSLPIYFWDEGLSSMEAEAALRDADKAVPERVDSHAAAVILQACLDAIHAGHPAPERFRPEIT